jgi:sugar O-acyltransferase (sialic acid O-acetyltransferase NeuD family)
MSDLIIIGAGGFGLEVAAYAEDMTRAGKADFVVKGFLDDIKMPSSRHAGYPVLGKIEPPFDSEISYVIAIGIPDSRKILAGKLGGARLASIIHPQSYVAGSAEISPGTVVAPFAFVGPEARIGNHCVLNTHTCVGHESRVGDYCVLSPHAGLQGGAQLGEGVFLGSQVYITRVTIGNRARVAAGAVVYIDVPPEALALGNPAAFRA